MKETIKTIIIAVAAATVTARILSSKKIIITKDGTDAELAVVIYYNGKFLGGFGKNLNI